MIEKSKEERYLEYEIFLRRYEQSSSLYEMRFDRSRQLTSEYANGGLKLLSVLNGGAILAVPALAQLFSVVGEAKLVVSFSIEIFAYGLIATALAYFVAYFSLELDCRAVSLLSDARSKVVVLDYLRALPAQNLDEIEKTEEIKRIEKSQKIYYRIAVGLQIVGIVLAFIGFGCFVWGSVAAKAMFGV